ncbi:lytic transglycosylase domain-containing protein [Asticcacaulis sp. YBE204]|uniref:lytic transglycosylase domain-containing protein n=1 Tax=Asticcacaulis sp. YBE204 TaxID=1282363 RepID=UPI000408523B|nr:lytic transglycosylase domain-containing protein [Asticcacaulis sp. YBE204]
MRVGLKAAATIAAMMTPGLAAAQVMELSGDGEYRTICTSLAPVSVTLRTTAKVPYESAIQRAADTYGLSPDLLISVIRQESGFNPNAVSPRGAIGLMQLLPSTAAELGVDPYDPAANIMGGAAYLRRQLDRFDGRIDLALAAYNAGAGAVARHKGVPPYTETRTYVARNLDRLSDGAGVPADPPPTQTCG